MVGVHWVDRNKLVAPYAGAWIEIGKGNRGRRIHRPSLPMRERGLKYAEAQRGGGEGRVAPYAGAWIEINKPIMATGQYFVAPYAGAWIEITR